MTNVIIRNTCIDDADQLLELCNEIYPFAPPWSSEQIASHVKTFQEGQFVAIAQDSGNVVGMASSLIILWDDYDPNASWKDFTSDGFFTNHDPANGKTLYAAEVMVSPKMRGLGIGKSLYKARHDLLNEKRLLRIRAGARLRGYSKYADSLSAGEYVMRVALGEIGDPTLSFQLGQGFRVIGVVSQYLRHDPESLGYAAIIEWLNSEVASQEDWQKQEEFLNGLMQRYLKPAIQKQN
jgi:ribosomal protein S18 acetylase RimI-like enzyme